MGFLGLLYRRPAQQPFGSAAQQGCEESLGDHSLQLMRTNTSIGGIPPALNFDRIMDGGTCPVCSPSQGAHRLVTSD